MTERRIFAGILLLIAAGAGWMTWLSASAGEDSKWMFGVFTVFFAAMGVLVLRPQSPPRPEEQPTETRFVSHRFLMLALLATAIGIVAAIVVPLLRG